MLPLLSVLLPTWAPREGSRDPLRGGGGKRENGGPWGPSYLWGPRLGQAGCPRPSAFLKSGRRSRGVGVPDACRWGRRMWGPPCWSQAGWPWSAGWARGTARCLLDRGCLPSSSLPRPAGASTPSASRGPGAIFNSAELLQKVDRTLGGRRPSSCLPTPPAAGLSGGRVILDLRGQTTPPPKCGRTGSPHRHPKIQALAWDTLKHARTAQGPAQGRQRHSPRGEGRVAELVPRPCPGPSAVPGHLGYQETRPQGADTQCRCWGRGGKDPQSPLQMAVGEGACWGGGGRSATGLRCPQDQPGFPVGLVCPQGEGQAGGGFSPYWPHAGRDMGEAACGAVAKRGQPPLLCLAPHFPSPPPAFVPARGDWSLSRKTPGAGLGPLSPVSGSWGRGSWERQAGLGTHGGSWPASKAPPPHDAPTSAPGGRRDGGGPRAGLGDRTSSWQDTGRQAGGSQPRSRPQGDKVTGA